MILGKVNFQHIEDGATKQFGFRDGCVGGGRSMGYHDINSSSIMALLAAAQYTAEPVSSSMNPDRVRVDDRLLQKCAPMSAARAPQGSFKESNPAAFLAVSPSYQHQILSNVKTELRNLDATDADGNDRCDGVAVGNAERSSAYDSNSVMVLVDKGSRSTSELMRPPAMAVMAVDLVPTPAHGGRPSQSNENDETSIAVDDSYSGYDRHFKKKFFSAELRLKNDRQKSGFVPDDASGMALKEIVLSNNGSISGEVVPLIGSAPVDAREITAASIPLSSLAGGTGTTLTLGGNTYAILRSNSIGSNNGTGPVPLSSTGIRQLPLKGFLATTKPIVTVAVPSRPPSVGQLLQQTSTMGTLASRSSPASQLLQQALMVAGQRSGGILMQSAGLVNISMGGTACVRPGTHTVAQIMTAAATSGSNSIGEVQPPNKTDASPAVNSVGTSLVGAASNGNSQDWNKSRIAIRLAQMPVFAAMATGSSGVSTYTPVSFGGPPAFVPAFDVAKQIAPGGFSRILDCASSPLFRPISSMDATSNITNIEEVVPEPKQ